MLELTGDERHARHPTRVAGIRHDLEGDLAAESLVVGGVHAPHAALPEEPVEEVPVARLVFEDARWAAGSVEVWCRGGVG